jgi:hypothetical protein
MSWLLSKTYLRWCEPRLIRRARERSAAPPFWVQPFRILAFTALILLAWFLAKFVPNVQPRPIRTLLAEALAISFTLVYVVPYLLGFLPHYVSVTEKGIGSLTVKDAVWWEYKDIESCEIASRDIDGQTVRVLAIGFRKGYSVIVGVHATVSTGQLCRVLAERGVPVSTAEAVLAE